MSGITDLRHFGARELEPLLAEETEEWERVLDWDFRQSADLVRRYADLRALGGCAFTDGDEIAGYGYTVVEDDRGLIGDLYVRPGWRGQGAEPRLFRALLDDLMLLPHVRRVETQLMLLDPEMAKLLQRERFVKLFERVLMQYGSSAPLPQGKTVQLKRFRIEPWAVRHLDAAAAMLVLSYDGHVDARINDQYRTLEGAGTFLGNLMDLVGCGVFFPGASIAAVDRVTGWLAGMVLTAFVNDGVAHITQLCVSPRARGTGLGYELLRRSVEALQAEGARNITLTVTTANTAAYELYRGCGFEEVRRFYAYVWERYQALF